MGVSKLQTLMTGASRFSKQFSIIIEEISDAKPPNKLSSCKIIAFPVFLTDLMIESLSNGDKVLRSIKSALIECFFIVAIDS